MNKRDFIHDNFPMQSKASPYLRLGTDYFVINPAWQSGKLPMPITEETTVNSKLQSKLQIEKAVEIISEEISPKEKDIEIMPDEKVYAGIDFGNGKDKGKLSLMSYNGEQFAIIKSIDIERAAVMAEREILGYLKSISVCENIIAKGEEIFEIKHEEVDNLREIALVNGRIINAIDNPFRAVTTRDKKKQNFREVLPKKSRKRKEWK